MQILQRGARRDVIRRRSTPRRTTAASCIAAAIWRAPRQVLSTVRRARPAGARAAACVRRPRSGQSRHAAARHAAATREAEQRFPRGARHLCGGAAGRSSLRRLGAVGPRPRAARAESPAAKPRQTLRQAMQIAAKSLPADSPQLAAANSSLGRVLLAQDARDEAAPLLRESYPILVQAQGENAVITQRTRDSARRSVASGRARLTSSSAAPRNIRYAGLSVSSA